MLPYSPPVIGVGAGAMVPQGVPLKALLGMGDSLTVIVWSPNRLLSAECTAVIQQRGHNVRVELTRKLSDKF
jgi:hypothetical protein